MGLCVSRQEFEELQKRVAFLEHHETPISCAFVGRHEFEELQKRVSLLECGEQKNSIPHPSTPAHDHVTPPLENVTAGMAATIEKEAELVVVQSCCEVEERKESSPRSIVAQNVLRHQDGSRGELIASQDFPEYLDHVCGPTKDCQCSFPDRNGSSCAELYVSVQANVHSKTIEVVASGLLCKANGYTIIKGVVVYG